MWEGPRHSPCQVSPRRECGAFLEVVRLPGDRPQGDPVNSSQQVGSGYRTMPMPKCCHRGSLPSVNAMTDEMENLIGKLREIEEQAGHAVHEVPQGLTNGRIAHIRILARYVRMRLEGRAVAPPEPLPEELRKGKRPN